MGTVREHVKSRMTEGDWRFGDDDYFDRYPSAEYHDLYESKGLTVELSDFFGSYQGDAAIVLSNDKGQYAVTVFGYGSCSGCDALQSCDTWQEVEAMSEAAVARLDWKESKSIVFQEMYDKMLDDDRKGDWYMFDPDFKEWVNTTLKEWAGVKP